MTFREWLQVERKPYSFWVIALSNPFVALFER